MDALFWIAVAALVLGGLLRNTYRMLKASNAGFERFVQKRETEARKRADLMRRARAAERAADADEPRADSDAH